MPCLNRMNAIYVNLLFLLLLSACVGPQGQATREIRLLDSDEQMQAVREMLSKSVDVAVNRLGRRDGYWVNPRVRIPPPEELRRYDHVFRRYGLERYVEEFAESLNHAAEAALPLAKPVLLAAIRDMPLQDAKIVLHGNDDAATRYFRTHSGAALNEQLLPIVSEAIAKMHVTSAYKRLLKKVAYLEKAVGPVQQNLDAHVTQAMLDGLYLLTAEEERRIRHSPKERGPSFIKNIFR